MGRAGHARRDLKRIFWYQRENGARFLQDIAVYFASYRSNALQIGIVLIACGHFVRVSR